MTRKRRSLLLLAVAAGLATSPGLAAQADAPQPGRWSCQTVIVNNTIYLSGVFDETAAMGEVETGFAQLLVSKYGFKDHTSCGRADMPTSTLAGLQAGQKDQVAQLRARGINVVVTGWIFVPAKASLPYMCSGAVTVRKAGESRSYYYMTQVMEMPGNIAADVSYSWHEYLDEVHPGFLWNPAGCHLLSADPGLQQTQLKGFVDQFAGLKYELKQVDWTYRPGAAAAVAADTTPSYYCQLLSPDDKIWYVSKVLPVEGAWDLTTYNQAWMRYVSTTLKLNPSAFRGGCESGPMKNERPAWAARKEQLNGNAGEQIFEVDWKYRPGQEAAVAPPAPAGSAASPSGVPAAATAAPPAAHASAAAPAPKQAEFPYLCLYTSHPENGQGQSNYYLTGVFNSATPPVTINQEWRKYVGDTYGAGSEERAQCNRLSPSPAAQQAMINALTNAVRAGKAQLIKVDWRP